MVSNALIIANIAFEEECAKRGRYEFIADYLLQEDQSARIQRREQHAILTNFIPQNTRDHKKIDLCVCKETPVEKCLVNCRNGELGVLCPALCGPFCHNNPFYTNQFVGYQKGALEMKKDPANPAKGYAIYTNIFIPKYSWIGPYLGVKMYVADEDEDYDKNKYTMVVAYCEFVINAEKKGNFTRMINHSIVGENVKAHTYRFQDKLVDLLYACEDIPAGNELLLNYGYNEDINQPWYTLTIDEAEKAGIDVSGYRSKKKKAASPVPGTSSSSQGNEEDNEAQGSDFDSADEAAGSGQNAGDNVVVGCLSCLACGNKKTSKKGKKGNAKRTEQTPLLEQPAKKAAKKVSNRAAKKALARRPGTSSDPDFTRLTRSMSKKGK